MSRTISARLRSPRRELRLYSGKNLTGGLHHFAGSDSNLRNDRFEGSFFRPMVAFHVESVWNRGRLLRGGPNDVALYTEPGWHGNAVCMSPGRRGDVVVDFTHRVESCRWVSRAACRAMD